MSLHSVAPCPPPPLPPIPPHLSSGSRQTTLLSCMAAVALTATSYADSLERAVASPERTPSDTLAKDVGVACGVVIPLTALGLAYVWPWGKRWWKSRRH
jgi:hypothetical protein